MMESRAGRVVMCAQAGPGSLLGLPGIIGHVPYTMTAMARKGSAVRFVTRSDFEDILSAEPSLYLGMLGLLAAQIHSAREAITEN
jgi:CRP-like cAMP-binding protein